MRLRSPALCNLFWSDCGVRASRYCGGRMHGELNWRRRGGSRLQLGEVLRLQGQGALDGTDHDVKRYVGDQLAVYQFDTEVLEFLE